MNITNDLQALVGLNMVCLAARKKHLLLKAFNSPKKAWEAKRKDLERIEGLQRDDVELILSAKKKIEPKKEIKRAEKEAIKIITFRDTSYPKALSLISDPPLVLYVKGEIKETDRLSIGIVGSRMASDYGKRVTREFVSELGRAGFTIVSGLAKGIDAEAHRTALKVGIRTLAVLGCGIDVVYPEENRRLFSEIPSSGAIISEFPLGTPPSKENFPQRNRIIAGLSLGIVVVEAAERSGALITARLAIEEGREVFAVPGPITSPLSCGTNKLIKDGVKLTDSSIEIVEELGPMIERVMEE
ncbi:MAG: DNA-processing protein DprA [bacterium]|nr:DNA-processing protein DprA [bacterium]